MFPVAGSVNIDTSIEQDNIIGVTDLPFSSQLLDELAS
jgi:hypothetical protein